MSSAPQPPRTYNQNHAPRKYTPGKRRVSIYWTWSYPWEANRDTDGIRQSLLDHDRGPESRLGLRMRERNGMR